MQVSSAPEILDTGRDQECEIGRESMRPKDTYKYHLKAGGKVIYRGITYDLIRREAEHQERFLGSRIEQIGRRTTHEAALRWARRGGKRPYRSADGT